VLRAKERASTPYSSAIFHLGLTFESVKKLGARHEKLALHIVLIMSKNISNKTKNQPIHSMSSKPLFGRKKDSFHVIME